MRKKYEFVFHPIILAQGCQMDCERWQGMSGISSGKHNKSSRPARFHVLLVASIGSGRTKRHSEKLQEYLNYVGAKHSP